MGEEGGEAADVGAVGVGEVVDGVVGVVVGGVVGVGVAIEVEVEVAVGVEDGGATSG